MEVRIRYGDLQEEGVTASTSSIVKARGEHRNKSFTQWGTESCSRGKGGGGESWRHRSQGDIQTDKTQAHVRQREVSFESRALQTKQGSTGHEASYRFWGPPFI